MQGCLKWRSHLGFLEHARIQRGGPGVRTPPPLWNLKILPKKKVISGFFGGRNPPPPPPPSSVTKNYHFRWTHPHENVWIRACWNLPSRNHCLRKGTARPHYVLSDSSFISFVFLFRNIIHVISPHFGGNSLFLTKSPYLEFQNFPIYHIHLPILNFGSPYFKSRNSFFV